jgi:hypothetical protein
MPYFFLKTPRVLEHSNHSILQKDNSNTVKAVVIKFEKTRQRIRELYGTLTLDKLEG